MSKREVTKVEAPVEVKEDVTVTDRALQYLGWAWLVLLFALPLGGAGLAKRVLLAFASYFAWASTTMVRSLWRYRSIPGPTPLPFIGNLHSLLVGPGFHVRLEQWQQSHGSCFKFFMGTSVVICSSELETVREVGLRQFSKFTNRQRPPPSMRGFLPSNVQAMGEYGLVSARDAYWRGVRSTSASIFHNVEMLGSFCPLMRESARELYAVLDEVAAQGQTIDIWRALGDMTLDVVGGTVFGVRFNAVKQRSESDVVNAARVFFQDAGFAFLKNPYVVASMTFPFARRPLSYLVKRFPTKNMRDTQWASDVLGGLSNRMYDDAMREMRDNSPASAQDEKLEAKAAPEIRKGGDGKAGLYEVQAQSFLKLFLKARNRESGELMSRQEVVAQAFIFVLAGYETTATTLANCVWLLSTNKDKERILLEEIDAQNATEQGEEYTGEALKKFPYVEAVIKETLRVHGPVPVVNRVGSETVQLKSHNVKIFKGDAVQFALRNMHYNPSYFPDPHSFRPERFLVGSSIYADQQQKAWMPFGLGPRMCVANQFAMNEAKIALITLYRRFTFTMDTADRAELKMRMGATLSPDKGIKVRVHRRDGTK